MIGSGIRVIRPDDAEIDPESVRTFNAHDCC